MRKNNLLFQFILLFILTALTSCEAIGGIFKAGVWVGIILVALVVGIIIFVLGKFRS